MLHMRKPKKKQVAKRPTKRQITAKETNRIPKQLYWIAGVLAILVVIVFSPALNGEITNWDDESYLLKTSFIKKMNGENMEKIWTENVKSNYHPITMLTYALEYSISGGKANPRLHHGTNILFHLLSSLLLLYFIFLLVGKWEIAGITATLFAIHPMHVESVAWISERKDVLYAFFYIAGLITYLKSIRKPKEKIKWLSLTGVLFVLSCLSKGMAVSFPMVLLLIDYLEKRLQNKGQNTLFKDVLLEKVPFILTAIGFGIKALNAQQDTGAIGMVATQDFSHLDRIFIATYGLCTYIGKLFIPIDLTALYLYPLKEGNLLPLQFYLSALPILALGSFLFLKYRKNSILVFGLGFFIATIIMVLQLIPVGRAILAERYSYVPYIGLFFILGHAFVSLNKKKPQWKTFTTAILVVWVIGLSILAFQRAGVWKNSATLWSDVIEKQPRAALAYHNLSYYYKRNNQHDLAFPLYNKGLEIDPNYLGMLVNRGSHYYDKKDYKRAMEDFNKAIAIDPNHSEALLNRGAVYHIQKQEAKAMDDYNKVIQLTPYESKAYLNRGMLLTTQNKVQDALRDLNKGIELNPNYGMLYYYRSKAYVKAGNKTKALADAQKAKTLGYKVPKKYLQGLGG